MRKQNATFLTAFTSEADQHLQNTDSFAHVELDDLACYVIADGIDDHMDCVSARLAVDTVISAFVESPSMSKRALKKYLDTANQALLTAKSKRRLKASVIIVVHNYAKMRYAQAGNVRLGLFRSGFLKEKSDDQSLSMDLVAENRLEKDKLTQHQERHNLYCYLGQGKEFAPFLSKKIKLTNTDVLTVYTRGIWEHLDEGELLDVLADASDEPQETVDTVEDLLLSKQPKPLEKFTFVAVFVNKVFQDPNLKRRIKKILAIVIPILIVVAIIAIILLVRYNKKQANIAAMNTNFLSAVEYMQTDNYIRAQKDCEAALELAEKLKDQEMQEETGNYLRLIESIIAGDDFLSNNQYESALNQYQNAKTQARYADNVSAEYICDKLERTSDYMSVYDLLNLGDTLAQNLQYANAESKYLEAKALASRIYFDKGREAALAALEKLYDDMKSLQENSEKETQEKAEQQAGAVSVIAEGDKAFAQGDYDGALVFYLTAQQKYEELGDDVQASAARQKVNSTQKKVEEQEEKLTQAASYLKQAETNQAKEDYVQAKKYYLLAKDIYAQLKDDNKVAELTRKIELVDSENAAAEAAKAKEEAEAKEAEEAEAAAAKSAEEIVKEEAASWLPVE